LHACRTEVRFQNTVAVLKGMLYVCNVVAVLADYMKYKRVMYAYM
jgi:hypothetical protein